MPDSPAPSKAQWTIETILPDESGVRFYLKQYKPFRLLALQESPSSFSSTYEREAAFTDNEWIQRIVSPIATTVVAADCDGRSILSSATILGPLPVPEDLKDYARGSNLCSGVLHWQLAAVYTRLKNRRSGLASAVLRSALEWVSGNARCQGSRCMVTAEVVKGSRGARALYEGLGFSEAGERGEVIRMMLLHGGGSVGSS